MKTLIAKNETRIIMQTTGSGMLYSLTLGNGAVAARVRTYEANAKLSAMAEMQDGAEPYRAITADHANAVVLAWLHVWPLVREQ